MRNRNTIEFLGVWEQLFNPCFNPLEFEGFRKEAGLNAFTMSPSRCALMDERFGKVDTPERETFRKEAYAYCVGQIISEARKRGKKCAWLALRGFATYDFRVIIV